MTEDVHSESAADETPVEGERADPSDPEAAAAEPESAEDDGDPEPDPVVPDDLVGEAEDVQEGVKGDGFTWSG